MGANGVVPDLITEPDAATGARIAFFVASVQRSWVLIFASENLKTYN
jgi:hypothetical protein